MDRMKRARVALKLCPLLATALFVSGQVAAAETPPIKLELSETVIASLRVDDERLRTYVSSDSRRLAYIESHGKLARLVVDGVASKDYDAVVYPVFSPDSRHLAYTARRGAKELVLLDGIEGSEYDGVSYISVVFSPDGKRLAYAARRGMKQFVVLDGKEGQEYEVQDVRDRATLDPELARQIKPVVTLSPQFSSDGTHLIYVVSCQGEQAVV